MADYLHGVEQYFLENTTRPIQVLSASVIGLIATAKDADDSTFPINKPVLVNSEKFIKSAGTSGTLRHSLEDVYRQHGAIVVVVRVEEGSDESATIANVIGGLDNDTNSFEGLSSLLFAESKLGVRPRLIIAPEFSDKVGVGAAMETVAKKLNAIAIIDGSENGYSDVVVERKEFDEALFVNCGIKLIDASGSEVTRKASATVAGHMVRVDNEEGYWHSPSNRKIYGIVGTSEPIDYAVGSKTCKANLYNKENVCCIINQDGGFYFWGNRLANGDVLPHQRIRYIVGDSILKAHQSAVDRNVTKNYVESVKNNVNKLLRRLVSRQVISGGECWLDSELNVSAIGTGQVYWDYDLGFYDIGERLTFRQHITDRYNESVFS